MKTRYQTRSKYNPHSYGKIEKQNKTKKKRAIEIINLPMLPPKKFFLQRYRIDKGILKREVTHIETRLAGYISLVKELKADLEESKLLLQKVIHSPERCKYKYMEEFEICFETLISTPMPEISSSKKEHYRKVIKIYTTMITKLLNEKLSLKKKEIHFYTEFKKKITTLSDYVI